MSSKLNSLVDGFSGAFPVGTRAILFAQPDVGERVVLALFLIDTKSYSGNCYLTEYLIMSSGTTALGQTFLPVKMCLSVWHLAERA